MDSFVYLIYTHEEYSDILDIHLKRLDKYFPKLRVSICTNSIDYLEKDFKHYSFHKIYTYNDKQPYGERLRSVLSQMSEKYVLLNHEHNIFVSNVEVSVLTKLITTMEEQAIDQLRMFVTGIQHPVFPENLTVVKNNGDYYISCATTLWRRDILLKITTAFFDHSFRCFECEPIQSYVSQFNNYYLSSSNDVLFVNEGHYLSYYFPVAHLTGNGKWRTNTPTNRFFIEELAEEYNIDLNKRGKLTHI